MFVHPAAALGARTPHVHQANQPLEPRDDREPRLHTRNKRVGLKQSEHFKSEATMQTSESAVIALTLSFQVAGGFCVVAPPDSTC